MRVKEDRLASRIALTGFLVAAFVVARCAGRDGLAGASLVGMVAGAALPAQQGRRSRGLVLLAGLLALAAVFALPQGVLARLLDILPVAVNGLLAGHFGATLRPGQEPLIARYTRLDWGGWMPPECAGYARALTGFWTLVLALLALAHAIVLAHGGGIDRGTALAANAALVAALFLGEHVLRTVRFPQLGIASPLRTLRVMALASGRETAAAVALAAEARTTTTPTRHAG